MSFDFHDTLNHHNNPTTSPSSTRRGRFGLFSRAKIAKWHFAYGVPLDTKSGGTLLQNLFRESLGDDIKTATYEVTSPSAAIAFLEMMQQLAGDGARRVGEENAEEHSSTSSGTDGSSADGSSTDDSTDDDSNNIINNNNKSGADFGNSDEKFIVVVDGMAALWMGPQILRSLRALSHVSCLCGFVHYPFSATEWYRDEPWLRDLPALPPPPPDATVGGDGTLGVKDAGPPRKITNKNEDADRAARLRAYEAAALGTFNRTIVVGDACRIALTELLRTGSSSSSTADGDGGGCGGDSFLVLNAQVSPDVFAMSRSNEESFEKSPKAVAGKRRTVRLVTVGTVCARKNQATIVRALGRLAAAAADAGGDAATSVAELWGGGVATHISLTIVGDVGPEPDYSASLAKLAAEVSSITTAVGVSGVSISGGGDAGGEGMSSSSSSSSSSSPSSSSFEVSVSMTGAISPEAALSAVARSDAFLFASRFESYGIAPLEASLLGVPIVTVPCGAFADRLIPESTIWVNNKENEGEEKEEDKDDFDKRNQEGDDGETRQWEAALGQLLRRLWYEEQCDLEERSEAVAPHPQPPPDPLTTTHHQRLSSFPLPVPDPPPPLLRRAARHHMRRAREANSLDLYLRNVAALRSKIEAVDGGADDHSGC